MTGKQEFKLTDVTSQAKYCKVEVTKNIPKIALELKLDLIKIIEWMKKI